MGTDTVQLSGAQLDALDKLQGWIRDGAHRPFVINGYAGTGKTVLARYIAETLGGYVPICAFTGKAASVLRRKGCSSATTIHRLIYQPKERGRERLRELETALAELLAENNDARQVRRLSEELAVEKKRCNQPAFRLVEDSKIREASAVIVDEHSMIDERLGADLASFGRPIIALGDPGQLPPVQGRPFFKGQPDVFLQEVHRQAQGNPIIQLATRARRGEHIPFGEYGASRVLPWGKIDSDDVLRHDQILVGRNRTREASNQRVRQLRGFRSAAVPEVGERLVCCRNNHDLDIMNGSTWAVDGVLATPGSDRVGLSLHDPDSPEQKRFLEAYTAPFRGVEVPWFDRDAEVFQFGYALTVHKSQGSEWPSVLVFDESSAFSAPHRHLYTAITRAAERLTIVR